MKNQIIKINDNIRQIMYALIGTDKPDREFITKDGNVCFINFTDEIDVEFLGLKMNFIVLALTTAITKMISEKIEKKNILSKYTTGLHMGIKTIKFIH